jgi:hypothetical protein
LHRFAIRSLAAESSAAPALFAVPALKMPERACPTPYALERLTGLKLDRYVSIAKMARSSLEISYSSQRLNHPSQFARIAYADTLSLSINTHRDQCQPLQGFAAREKFLSLPLEVPGDYKTRILDFVLSVGVAFLHPHG